MARDADWDAIVQRCEALDHAMWERATALATAAGVGVARNVWSNAMIALDAGRPWSGVDYSLLRAALRVDARRDQIWPLRSRLWRRHERKQYPERFR